MARYEVILFDAYGVLVHATGAMPGAADTIARLNRSGQDYAVLTNDASKLPETAAKRYHGFGLDIAPERILSSGLLLREYFTHHRLRGRNCAVLGTADSVRFAEQAGARIVAPGEPFDVLVVGDENGYQFVETVDATLSALFHQIDTGQHVHLVLPNPDLIFPHGPGRFGIAAGSIALIVEAALRRRYPERRDLVFHRLGKPQPDLYEAAIKHFGSRDAVMIGDQLETDIAGAAACGIDSALIATGVALVNQAMLTTSIRPTYWMSSLINE